MNNLNRLHPCPCCGSPVIHEVGAYEICSVCGWEDDPSQSKDRTLKGGANELSLNQARRRWKKHLREQAERDAAK